MVVEYSGLHDDSQGSNCKAPLKSMHTSKERYNK